ncbi:MAG: FAD-binding oxidoreductase [Acidimicrobiia bacterium]|nr:FAD-binding oxidoreductase [Acidimicrobiia bacterium]
MTAPPKLPAKLPSRFIDDIKAAVGPHGWATDEATLAPHLGEERGNYRGSCAVLVSPASTDEVARVVRLCAEASVALTPQGGNTGLAGGAVPASGVLLSLKRMKRIRALDALNFTMVAEAGCVLADVQRAADEAGALFPLSLAAEGSCTVGGNISTNAGGVHVLRYGNTRDLVLGIEAVLPDGRVWNGLRALRKDNTGYDLKQLFIGAEGTLGVVTAATLKLFPKLKARAVAFAALASPAAALDLFARLRERAGETLCAFEFANRFALDCVLRHAPGARDPFGASHPWYVLTELASPHAKGDALAAVLEAVLAEATEAETVADATIAQSEAQAAALWQLRESISEAQKPEGGSLKHDVSVPVACVPDLVTRGADVAARLIPGVRVCAFGHMGDGNVHFNLSQPAGADRAAFLAMRASVNRAVHDLVRELGGSFSAEHGVGQLRLADMARYKSEVELDIMRAVKTALDPKGIMNPGKVLPPR